MMSLYLRLTLFALVGLSLAGCPTYIAERTEPGAIVDTTLGSFTIQLDPNAAPQAVSTFAELVDAGHYDNTLFHEVVPGNRVRAGGYRLGLFLKDTREPIVNESDNGRLNLRGTIAMARTSEPNSATSQFYFNLKDNADLNPQDGSPGYAVFGDVVEGFGVVEQIAQIPTEARGDLSDVPEEDVFIESVERMGEVGGKIRVRIQASRGDIVVDLDVQAAPVSVENFLQYVDDGFYAGTLFHRVVSDFVVQGGGYTLGPVAVEAPTIRNDPNDASGNVRGAVALYFEDDPNTLSPRFLVNLQDNPEFDATEDSPGFPVIGAVVEGLEVVEQIAGVATSALGDFTALPAEDVLIEQITLTEVPIGGLELTDAGEYYAANSRYEARLLLRELLSNLIYFAVAGG